MRVPLCLWQSIAAGLGDPKGDRAGMDAWMTAAAVIFTALPSGYCAEYSGGDSDCPGG